MLIFFGNRRKSFVGLSIVLIAVIFLTTLHFVKVTNPIKNGDFSEEFQNWATIVTQPKAIVNPPTPGSAPSTTFPQFNVTTDALLDDTSHCTPTNYAGKTFAAINVPYESEGYIEQVVTIPWTGEELSLISWGWEDYSFVRNGTGYVVGIFSGVVRASVSIVDSAFTERVLYTYIPPPMISVVNQTNTVTGKTVCTGRSPISLKFTLSDYEGQTVRVRLRATSNTPQDLIGTYAMFDDVSISTPNMFDNLSAYVQHNYVVFLGVVGAAIPIIGLWNELRKRRSTHGGVIVYNAN